MRVGIDGACWLNRRGYGRFARALVGGLVALGGGVEYTLIVDFDPADAPPIPAGVRVIRIPTRKPGARAAAANGQRSLRDLWMASRLISRERFDIVFFPSVYTYVPIVGRSGIVVVIHDVIPEEFPREVFATRRSALQWTLKLFVARRQADLVMTVSQASKEGIARRFGIPTGRIAVVSEAADAGFRPLPPGPARTETLARWGLKDGLFVLYVGGISPHKNLDALIQAFAELRARAPVAEYKLVLVGDYATDVFHSAYDVLRQKVAELRLEDVVVFTGYVPDEALVSLYNAAAACVLPSLWEGFGLPVVEALACGTPVVASARGALPEVIGTAGLLFDPKRPGDLGTVLQRLLDDPDLQSRLRQSGVHRAAEFSWERSARQALSALHAVAARRRHRNQPLAAAPLSKEEHMS